MERKTSIAAANMTRLWTFVRKQPHSQTFVAVLTLLFAIFSNGQALSTCDSWKQLANQMRQFENHTGFISCEAVNCSGVSCVGFLQENFTLGVSIDPCVAPLAVQVHGSVPSLTTHSEHPWSATIQLNETDVTYGIPGAKLTIEGVEMNVYLIASVLGYPNATLDVDLTLKACFGTHEAAEIVDPVDNCSLSQQILKSGPIKVPPCHDHPSEGEIHSLKPHVPSVIPQDAQDYVSGGSRPSSVVPTIPTRIVTSATSPPTTSSSSSPSPPPPPSTHAPSSVSFYETKFSKPCSLKDLYNYFACDVRNHEVCSPIDPPLSGAEHGMCMCMIAYVRSSSGVCVLSQLDQNGDPRRTASKKSEEYEDEDEDENHVSPASSSKYSGQTGHDDPAVSTSHGGAVAAGILIPLLAVVVFGGAFIAYRRGLCPPNSLQQPLRFSLSRFSTNRSPGMVLIGDGDEEAVA